MPRGTVKLTKGNKNEELIRKQVAQYRCFDAPERRHSLARRTGRLHQRRRPSCHRFGAGRVYGRHGFLPRQERRHSQAGRHTVRLPDRLRYAALLSAIHQILGAERAGQIPRNAVAERHRQQDGAILPTHSGAAGRSREEELHGHDRRTHGSRLRRAEDQRRGKLLRP